MLAGRYTYLPMKVEQSVPKLWHIKSDAGKSPEENKITQKKTKSPRIKHKITQKEI
jgi:hypothetical protein